MDVNQKQDYINQLWSQYRKTKTVQIRELLIEHYLPLVKLVAGRVAIGMPAHVDKEDLVSNGFFGLLEALDRFDPAREIKFETYAVARIRGSILDSIRAQDWVPATLRQKARQYEKTLADVENRLGRSATDQEIAEALDITVTELQHLLNKLSTSTIIPLEEFAKTETSSNQSFNPSENIEEKEVKETLVKTIDRLPDKERLVVTLYYYEGLTLKEIGKVLGVSESRISQLHTKAVFRLRGRLNRMKKKILD